MKDDWNAANTVIAEVQSTLPTPTPAPTAALTPTPSPIPPTLTPTPLPPPQVTTVNGTGKQLTDPVHVSEGLAIITMKHQGSSNFAIWLDRQDTGDRLDLLVNEIGSWQGSRAISIDTSGDYLFEVEADGPWSIEISEPTPLNAAVVDSPHQFSGTGTQALYFLKVGSGIHKVTVTHNGKSNFIMIAYNSDASSRQLLFNEIGAVDSSAALRIGGRESHTWCSTWRRMGIGRLMSTDPLILVADSRQMTSEGKRMNETRVKNYKGTDEYAEDSQKMAREGWKVVSSSEQSQRTGCMRFVMLGGIGALVFKPKSHVLVTYERELP